VCRQGGDQLGRERPTGARHLGAARRGRVDVLVGIQRPASVDVAVTDRLAEPPQQLGHGLVAGVQLGDPQPITVRVEGDQLEAYGAVAAERDHPAHATPRGHGPIAAADLDHPPALVEVRHRRREVHAERLVAPRPGDGGGQRRRDVDDQQIVAIEQLRQLEEPGVQQRATLAVGDHQPDTVTPQAALLRGLGRLQTGRQLEGKRAHEITPLGASSRAT
jgi:hypothetical protein